MPFGIAIFPDFTNRLNGSAGVPRKQVLPWKESQDNPTQCCELDIWGKRPPFVEPTLFDKSPRGALRIKGEDPTDGTAKRVVDEFGILMYELLPFFDWDQSEITDPAGCNRVRRAQLLDGVQQPVVPSDVCGRKLEFQRGDPKVLGKQVTHIVNCGNWKLRQLGTEL